MDTGRGCQSLSSRGLGGGDGIADGGDNITKLAYSSRRMSLNASAVFCSQSSLYSRRSLDISYVARLLAQLNKYSTI